MIPDFFKAHSRVGVCGIGCTIDYKNWLKSIIRFQVPDSKHFQMIEVKSMSSCNFFNCWTYLSHLKGHSKFLLQQTWKLLFFGCHNFTNRTWACCNFHFHLFAVVMTSCNEHDGRRCRNVALCFHIQYWIVSRVQPQIYKVQYNKNSWVNPNFYLFSITIIIL